MKKSTKAVIAGTAAVALGTAAYLLSGKRGEAKRKKLKGWMQKMWDEVEQELLELKTLTQESYLELVDRVKDRYARLKNVDRADLDALVDDLKKHWQVIKRKMDGKL